VNDSNTQAGPDYKQTLNLPQTDFPMQAGLAQREPQMLAQWQAEDLYAQVQAATQHRTTPYWFVDGPPYANGDIHIGHAVNKVLKDMVVKSARLDGHYAPFVPGWDCHGLPIELQVEKKFGKVGEKLDAAAFRAKCREYALEQIDRQRADFKRLGVLADWDKPYLTMQPAFEAEQLRVLARIVENGHVVRGFKPVHWCADCGSSLAEAEVEYQDKQSSAIYVSLVAADPAAVAAKFGVANAPEKIGFMIWTTTPWSLPGNQAIALNPDFNYVLADFGGHGVYVLAEERVEALANHFAIADVRCLGSAIPGKELAGLKGLHPFADGQLSPIVLGQHVTLDAGTGLVHTAPAHGADDYEVCREYGVEVVNPVGMDSRFKDGTPLVSGLHLRKAEPVILDALRASGALVHLDTITHSYPHCWRHKTPLYTLATAQWFVSMDDRGLREQALKAIGETRWIPGWGEERIRGMVADRPDWCISRQRTWGVPLALFVHKRTQTPHPESAALLRRVADQIETGGLEAWFGSSVSDWLPAEEVSDYDKCPDTLDVWFDSGSVHQCAFVATNPAALDANGLAPQADFYLEGSDQHRGWFMSSLLTSVAMRGRAPYKAVLTHGFTVDEQGRKMSKSVGNVVAPQTVTKTLGADVLRLWAAASDYSGEIAISDNLLKRIADAYRRIRNTARYLLSNLHGFAPAQHLVPPSELLAVDRWALGQLALLQDEIRSAYRESQFHLVYQKLHNYCVVDLGGLYLDILKDRLYTLPENSPARRSAQTVLFHIAESIVRWIAPILSFTADEIWKLLPGDRSQSVFAQTWYTIPEVKAMAPVDWEKLLALRDQVKAELEGKRQAGLLGSALDAKLVLFVDPAFMVLANGIADELRFWFLVSDVALTTSAGEWARLTGRALTTPDTATDVEVVVSDAVKCSRCWHRRADVGLSPAHPALCGRCIENIEGAGETRLFI
jgi:isoleucyl-tRNA synthetase